MIDAAALCFCGHLYEEHDEAAALACAEPDCECDAFDFDEASA